MIYGSDAVGGVINVIAENPVATNTIEGIVNSQYHFNTAGLVSNIGLKKSGEKWFGGLSFTNKSHKDYQDSDQNQIKNSRFKDLNIGTNVGYRTTFGNFSVSYYYT